MLHRGLNSCSSDRLTKHLSDLLNDFYTHAHNLQCTTSRATTWRHISSSNPEAYITRSAPMELAMQ